MKIPVTRQQIAGFPSRCDALTFARWPIEDSHLRAAFASSTAARARVTASNVVLGVLCKWDPSGIPNTPASPAPPLLCGRFTPRPFEATFADGVCTTTASKSFKSTCFKEMIFESSYL